MDNRILRGKLFLHCWQEFQLLQEQCTRGLKRQRCSTRKHLMNIAHLKSNFPNINSTLIGAFRPRKGGELKMRLLLSFFVKLIRNEVIVALNRSTSKDESYLSLFISVMNLHRWETTKVFNYWKIWISVNFFIVLCLYLTLSIVWAWILKKKSFSKQWKNWQINFVFFFLLCVIDR